MSIDFKVGDTLGVTVTPEQVKDALHNWIAEHMADTSVDYAAQVKASVGDGGRINFEMPLLKPYPYEVAFRLPRSIMPDEDDLEFFGYGRSSESNLPIFYHHNHWPFPVSTDPIYPRDLRDVRDDDTEWLLLIPCTREEWEQGQDGT